MLSPIKNLPVSGFVMLTIVLQFIICIQAQTLHYVVAENERIAYQDEEYIEIDIIDPNY